MQTTENQKFALSIKIQRKWMQYKCVKTTFIAFGDYFEPSPIVLI